MRLVTRWFGAFLLEGDTIESERLFPNDPKELALRLSQIQSGEVLEEERDLAARAGTIEVSERRLLSLPGAAWAPQDARELPREPAGFGPGLYREAMVLAARERTRAALAGQDRHLVEAVNAIDNLSEVANLLAERLREWYALHFPELCRTVEGHPELAALVSAHGTREKIVAAEPRYEKLLRDTLGAEGSPADVAAVQALAKTLSHVYETRSRLERHLEDTVPQLAPNLAALAGPAIAARLIHRAKGLGELARMSAGTIQTLGAEAALFRHLRDGNAPPKHGVLFVHPLVHRAPKEARGAVARALAGKLAIAARADAITKGSVAGELQDSLDRRVLEIRQRSSKPRGRPARGGRRGAR